MQILTKKQNQSYKFSNPTGLSNANVRGMALGNGVIVAALTVHQNGYNKLGLLISQDLGNTWQLCQQVDANSNQFANGKFNCVCYGNNTWLADGDFPYYSTDNAQTWIPVSANGFTNDSERFDVDAAYGAFVAAGQNSIYRSTNARNWSVVHTHLPLPEGLNHARFAHGNNLWVMGGTHNAGPTGEAFHVSTDFGQTWTARAVPEVGGILDIAFGQGKFVGVGGDYVATTTDGINWTKRTINLPEPIGGDNQLSAVAYSQINNLWLIATYNRQFFISPDAQTWTETSFSNISGSHPIECVLAIN